MKRDLARSTAIRSARFDLRMAKRRRTRAETRIRSATIAASLADADVRSCLSVLGILGARIMPGDRGLR